MREAAKKLQYDRNILTILDGAIAFRRMADELEKGDMK